MFKTLSSKLTITFGALFALVLLLLAVTSYYAINHYAKITVQNEMAATSKVLDRLWRQKSENLQDSAVLLAHDFGFQSAVSTNDKATIDSAYNNIKNRINADEGLIIGPNGEIVGGNSKDIAAIVTNTLNTSEIIGPKNGIITINNQSFSTIAAPILAPNLMGWVVFASRIDKNEMKGLEDLSSIPLSANIVTLSAQNKWQLATKSQNNSANNYEDNFFNKLVSKYSNSKKAEIVKGNNGYNIIVFSPLKTFDETQKSVLMLSYPLSEALKTYQPLLGALFILGFLSLITIVLLCGYLARSLTQPVAKLKAAADALAIGNSQLVSIEGQDEMAGLASAFNTMAISIREREADINFMAKHDINTKLPNRVASEEYIANLTISSAQNTILVTCIELQKYDHLRSVWGSDFAHAAILKISETLKSYYNNAFIGRSSADSLVIILQIEQSQNAYELAKEILSIAEGRVQISEHNFDLQLRIGYNYYINKGAFENFEHAKLNAREIIERAIIALDQAKAGKLSIAQFDDKIFAQFADKLKLTDDLHIALDNKSIEVFYQPKYNYRTQKINSCEALVRWFHKERGFVSPQTFVEIAEETGYIADLTRQVLLKAIEDQASLKALGFDIDFSINYSGLLLSDTEFNNETLQICKTASGKICLEITETAVISDPEIGIAAIDNFRDNGIEISIDDFGTGLSSLAYLKLIRANELKIDRSFIVNIDKGQRDALLVRSTIDLAHGLGMKVTAEGVESETSISLLAAMGCDIAQGYGIGKPMPFNNFKQFIDSFNLDTGEPKQSLNSPISTQG